MTGPAEIPINVALLLRGPGERDTVSRTVALGPIETTAAALDEPGDVHVMLDLESTNDGIVVTGTIEVPWSGACRRCLETTGGTVRAEVLELFSDGLSEPAEGEPPAVDAYPIEGTWIDIGPLVHDAAVLALPLAPLCSEECRGPRPEEFPVITDPEELPAERDPRWDALSELRFDSD